MWNKYMNERIKNKTNRKWTMIDILYEFLIVKFESGKRKNIGKKLQSYTCCRISTAVESRVNTPCSGENTTFYHFLPYRVTQSYFTRNCKATVSFYGYCAVSRFSAAFYKERKIHYTCLPTWNQYPLFFGLTSSKIFIKECTFLQFFSRFQDIEVPSDMTNQSKRDPGTPSGKNNKRRTTTKHRKTKD